MLNRIVLSSALRIRLPHQTKSSVSLVPKPNSWPMLSKDCVAFSPPVKSRSSTSSYHDAAHASLMLCTRDPEKPGCSIQKCLFPAMLFCCPAQSQPPLPRGICQTKHSFTDHCKLTRLQGDRWTHSLVGVRDVEHPINIGVALQEGTFDISWNQMPISLKPGTTSLADGFFSKLFSLVLRPSALSVRTNLGRRILLSSPFCESSRFTSADLCMLSTWMASLST